MHTAIALAAAGFLAVTAAQHATAQEPDTIELDPTYRAPRTVDGQPDISGVWTNDTLTPLERPLRLGDQAFYTEEEAAELARRGRESYERDSAPGRSPTVPGQLRGGYNRFWSEMLDSVVYTRRTSMIANPATGRVPTRPEAEEHAAWIVEHRTDSHENMSPYSRCITRGMPGSMIPNTYNTGNHILQIPGYVVILYEMVREPRIIPLDDRPPIHANIDQWMGDARGRWEGETLVVETTNFTAKGWITPNQNAGRMHGVPVSTHLRLVERFTRVAEDILDWEVRVEDPEVYTQPWTLELPLVRNPDYVLYEYACHEGNRAVTGILGGARYVETRANAP